VEKRGFLLSLKHFGHLSAVVLKLTVTGFISLSFLTLWPNWPQFFWSFKKNIRSKTEKLHPGKKWT